MRKGQRISKQVIACSMVMFFILISFLVFAKENERRVLEQNMEYIQDSTIQIAERIDHVFSDGYSTIDLLSATLSQSLEQPKVDMDYVREVAGDTFDFIEFADRDGMNHNITGGVSDARDRQYYLDGIKGNTGMELIFNSRATHETLMLFYAPVTFEGEIIGVLIGAYQADNKMTELLKATYFGEQANLYLCTPEGRVVASNLPLDTKANLNFTDLAQSNDALVEDMRQTMKDGKDLNFTLQNQKSGGCMTKLPETGWFLIQIFPEAANVTMVHEANQAGVQLEITLLLLFIVVLILLIHFYRKERRDIADIAEERGEYKNAVLADAIIALEVNLTKNQIEQGVWKNKDQRMIPLEELLGENLFDDYDAYIRQWADIYVCEESKEMFLEYTSRAYMKNRFEQGKSGVSFEYYAKSLEGEKIFVRRNVYLTKGKKSGDLIAYSNVKDFTEQKQKELQMYQYEQMLLMAASGMYQGAWQIDLSDFSTVYLSFEDNHVVPRDRKDWNVWLAGQEQYVHPDDLEVLREKLCAENLLKMPVKGNFRFDFRSNRKSQNGFYRVYSTSGFKAKRDGKFYVNLITMDNTEAMEKEMKQKALIEDALLRAESASNAKTKFLSNMSHDIRTPLNAIIGFTTLAVSHIDNKEQVEGYLKKISVSGNHLLSLINDVLDMSRIESGRVQLEETECSLSEIINEIENMLMPEMQSRKLEFHIDMENVANDRMICDRLRLNQILLNLLGNAMKFTAPGGKVSLLIFENQKMDGEESLYEIHVRDTGIGMSKEFLEHLYEPFERERSSTVSGVQGTGLGMTITKNLVEMMGGTISVFSEKGVGTEFTLQLPVKKAAQQKEDSDYKEGKSESEIRMSMEGKRILLVEDNDLNREIAGEILSEAGLLVEEAEDGNIAVDMLLEKGPGYYSLVLMDIQMPVMDGYEATQAIRSFENKELANIPIIAMTANAFEEDRRRALEMGMNAHVAKPVDVPKLLNVMADILS